jgi:hypothetical protein
MVTTGNKCIRTEYHWVKESYELGDISPQRIETTWNLSECMTKALPRETIERVVAMSHAAVETQWVRDWIKMGFEPLDEKGTCTLHSPVIAMCQTGKFKVCTV